MADLLPYSWDYNAHRWRGPRGLFVADGQVRAGLDTARYALEMEMVALGERLQHEDVTLDQWEVGMLALIKEGFVLETLVRVGPILSAAHEQQLANQLTEQATYLQNFAIQIYTGATPLDGRFLWRARLYARSASNGAEETRRGAMEETGYTQEQRVLSASESCQDCIEAAGRWMPIGTLPRIGDSRCRMNCNCHFIYR